MGLKYYFSVVDDNDANKKKVEIHLTGYAAGTTELTPLESGLRLKTFGTEFDLHERIVSSEYRVDILVDASEKTTYDEFLTAGRRDYQVYIYDDPDGANTLEWSGYLRTSNSRRDYNNFLITYELVASDGLRDLQDIEYKNEFFNVPIEGHESGLTIIDRCLDRLDFSLGYEIHLNMYNDQMTSTECALEETTHDNDHLYSIRNGEEQWISMWEAVTRILTTYNSYLMQVDGIYKIVNWQEYNSYKHVYNSSLVKQSRPSEDLSLTVTSYNRQGTGDLRIMKPIEQLDLYVRDYSKGSELLVNGEFDSGTSNWTNSGFETFSVTDGILTFGQTDNVYGNTIESDAFAIGSLNDGDILSMQVKFTFNTFTSVSNPYPPGLRVYLEDPNGNPSHTASWARDTFTDYIVLNIDYFPSVTGNYKVVIAVDANEDTLEWTEIEWSIDYIRVALITTEGNARDKRWRFRSDSSPVGIHDYDVYFSDAVQSDQASALKVSGSNTSTWSRYGKGESIPIVQILGQEYMNDFQTNRYLVDITVRDDNDEIRPDNLIILDGKNYRITAMERDHRTTQCRLSLAEVNNSDDTLDIDTFALTSIDGQSTIDGGAGAGSGGGAISIYQPWANATGGTYTNVKVGIGSVPDASYQLKVNGDTNIVGDLYINGVISAAQINDLSVETVLAPDDTIAFWDVSESTHKKITSTNLASDLNDELDHNQLLNTHNLNSDILDSNTSPGEILWNDGDAFAGVGDWTSPILTWPGSIYINGDNDVYPSKPEARITVYNQDTAGGNPGAEMSMFSGQYGEWGLRIGDGNSNRILWGAGGYTNFRSYWNGIRWQDTSDVTVFIVTDTGELRVNASTTSDPHMNLDPGATPTTPDDGDLWLTTTSIYAQINGATVDLGAEGTVTEVTVGTGLDVATGTTTPDITLSLDELSEKSGDLVGSDRLVVVSGTSQYAETISGIPLSIFDDDLTYDNYVSWTIAADSGSDAVTSGQTMTIAGGTNVTTSISGTTLTIDASGGGSGDVSASGTPVADQLAIWVDATTIKGVSGLEWDSTGRIIEIASSSTQAPDFKLSADSVTTGTTLIGSVLQFWDAAEAVARIAFYSGSDTTNRDDGSIMMQTSAAGSLIDRFGISSAGVISIETAPSTADGSDEILLRDATSGNVTKLGIGTNLSVSGGDLVASSGASISGTPSDNQLAIWTNSSTIEGDSDLRFDGDTLFIGPETGGLGVLNIDCQGGPSVAIDITADASETAYMNWYNNARSTTTLYLHVQSGNTTLNANGSLDISGNTSGTDQTLNFSSNGIYFDASGVGFGDTTPASGYVDCDYNLRVKGGGVVISRQQTAGVAQTLFSMQNSSGGARGYMQMTSGNDSLMYLRNSGGTNRVGLLSNGNSFFLGTLTVGQSGSPASGYSFEIDGSNAEGLADDWDINSDRSKKMNIQPYGRVLDRVEILGLDLFKKFQWKKNRKDSVGVIAQDWLDLFPELVKGEEGSYTMSYQKMGVLALQAVNEHREEVRNEIKELKEKIKRLESLII